MTFCNSCNLLKLSSFRKSMKKVPFTEVFCFFWFSWSGESDGLFLDILFALRLFFDAFEVLLCDLDDSKLKESDNGTFEDDLNFLRLILDFLLELLSDPEELKSEVDW